MKSFLYLVLVIVVLLTSCQEASLSASEGEIAAMEPLTGSQTEATTPAELLQQNGSGMIVQIRTENQLGSGVIYQVENDCLVILTAAHVLTGESQNVTVIFNDGATALCKELLCFEKTDLAVVKIDRDQLSTEQLIKYRCALVDKKHADKLMRGDRCIAFGYSPGVGAEAFTGCVLDQWIYMEDYDQYMIWVKAEGKPGMSGGGLFDEEGYLLGVLSGCSSDGELAVVPMGIIQETLTP